MSSLMKVEFYKLWKRRSFLIFLISIFILNIGIIAFHQNSDIATSPLVYKQFQDKLSQMSNEERYAYVENYYQKTQAFELLQQVENLQRDSQKNKDLIESLYSENPEIKNYQEDYQNQPTYELTGNLESESIFISQVYKEFKTLHDYPQYIESILNKAKTISSISIFQKENDFSNKNLVKSSQDYQDCLKIPITYESEKGINDALSFPTTHFLIVFSLIGIAMYMIIEEKEKNLFTLIQTTKRGQKQTIIAKCLVMFISVGVIITIFTLSQFVYMSYTIGLGELSRSLQSLASYRQCPFQINVYQFIIIYIFMRWLVISLIGIFILWISLITKNKVMCFVVILSFFLFEFACYIFITPLSSFYLLKYINFIYILQTDQLFQLYRNVNAFSQAISLQLIITVICFIIFVFLTILLIRAYQQKRNIQSTNFQFNYFQKQHLSLSLWKQELYKVLWIQKVLSIIIACLCLQFYQYSNIHIYQDQENLVYNQYMKSLEGPLNQDKEKFLQQEKQKFIDLNQQLDKIIERENNHLITKEEANNQKFQIESLLQDEQVFQKVYQEYERILQNPSLQFVIPSIYDELLLSPNWVLTPYILLFVFLSLSLSQVYSFEYQNDMHKVITPTSLGHKTLKKKKFIISFIIMCIFFILINFPPLFILQKTFGFSALTAPLQSLKQFQNFPIEIPLWSCILFLYLIRFLAAFFFISFLHLIERKLRSQLLTMIIINLIVVVPLILIYGNFSVLETISVYPIIMFPQYLFLQENVLQFIISIVVYSSITIFSLYKIFMKPDNNN
ncbi:MAG: hypothetical protein RR630_04060 [Coprobacillus sp.]